MPKMKAGANETVLLIPAEDVSGVPYALTPAGKVAYDALTNAVFNHYIPITTPGHADAGWGGNITCATIDDMNLGPSDSDEDDVKTLCSTGPSNELTFYNFDAEFNFLRDAVTLESTSAFNLPRDLLRAPDVPYLIAHRVGYSSTTNSANGHEWDIYYVHTDNTVPTYDDGGNQGFSQTFVEKGILKMAHVTAS